MNNMNAETLRMNSGQLFFYLIGFIPFLICFPIWTVVRFVWTPWKKEIMEEILEKVPFSDLYPYSEEYNDDYKTNYENNVVIEDTPNGTVIMKYDENGNVFKYWCNKTVLQDVLNTCARKYVKVFHCSEIYHNEEEQGEEEKGEEEQGEDKENEEQPEDNETKKNEEEHTEKKEEESDDDGVFVKFKAQKTKEANAEVEKNKENKEKTINKFLKVGSINDYMMIPMKAREFTKKLTSEKKMSWSDWLSKSKLE